ncbi:MAG: hypothetical protein D6679_03655 [Candidatus Hydrogenedentota bacterium]|nr:MAG: hypothetical protein D6679_03655 [Candidatus Hydrogenedentota bacterium]
MPPGPRIRPLPVLKLFCAGYVFPPIKFPPHSGPRNGAQILESTDCRSEFLPMRESVPLSFAMMKRRLSRLRLNADSPVRRLLAERFPIRHSPRLHRPDIEEK